MKTLTPGKKRAKFKWPNQRMTRIIVYLPTVVLGNKTFTYSCLTVVTSLFITKILYKQYKWNSKVPIDSSHSHECHGTKIQTQFCLYCKALNKNVKP